MTDSPTRQSEIKQSECVSITQRSILGTCRPSINQRLSTSNILSFMTNHFYQVKIAFPITHNRRFVITRSVLNVCVCMYVTRLLEHKKFNLIYCSNTCGRAPGTDTYQRSGHTESVKRDAKRDVFRRGFSARVSVLLSKQSAQNVDRI